MKTLFLVKISIVYINDSEKCDGLLKAHGLELYNKLNLPFQLQV